MTVKKKLVRFLCCLCVCLSLTNCGYSVRLVKSQGADELCNDEALKECPKLSAPSTESNVVTAVAWGTEYNYCALLHKIALHCIADAKR